MQRRKLRILILAMMGSLAAPPVALASGDQDVTLEFLTFADAGTQLIVFGELANLDDDKSYTATVTVTGKSEVVCVDPNGNELGVDTTFFKIKSKVTHIGLNDEGLAVIDIITDTPGKAGVIPGAPDCPHPGWTEVVAEVGFVNPTVTVKQAGENLVLECASTQSSQNGIIPEEQLVCVQKKP